MQFKYKTNLLIIIGWFTTSIDCILSICKLNINENQNGVLKERQRRAQPRIIRVITTDEAIDRKHSVTSRNGIVPIPTSKRNLTKPKYQGINESNYIGFVLSLL